VVEWNKGPRINSVSFSEYVDKITIIMNHYLTTDENTTQFET